jgi:ParB family transcriptional regulator, chromosome partitioning protein
VSWVSRRLNLIKALPEDLLDAVRTGRIPLWAATRILTPLARANAAHARTLLAQLEQQPLSTRELGRLYEQYRQASKVQRRRLVENPALFRKALDSRDQATADKRLAAGPEGVWYNKDLRVVSAIIERLLGQVPTLFAPIQEVAERERLLKAFAAATAQFQRLERALAESASHDR